MEIEVGKVYEGRVDGVANFGIFIKLKGGIKGLIHYSRLSDDERKEIEKLLEGGILRVGKWVRVKVVAVVDNGEKVDFSLVEVLDDSKRPRTFEELFRRFKKDSEERLSDSRRRTDAKLGGKKR